LIDHQLSPDPQSGHQLRAEFEKLMAKLEVGDVLVIPVVWAARCFTNGFTVIGLTCDLAQIVCPYLETNTISDTLTEW
jgi:hypothetical protein